MKNLFSAALLCLMILSQTSICQAQIKSEESPEDKEKRMEWFSDAKLGIFIHWGIYAVKGVSESWSFYNNRLSHEEYMEQLKGFTASKYDPQEWAKLIKESGAKYTVLTTKHHDGVALWNTKANKLSVVKCTPAKRDLITPFAEAVREQGLRLGLYFSLLDWSHPDYPNMTRTQKRYQEDPKRWAKFCKFNFAQLSELNLGWKPDLFWFDGDWEQSAEKWNAKGIVEMLRKDNPNVIINSRIRGYGDYATPEQGIPVIRPEHPYWELCMTTNDSWGFQHEDTNFKSPYILLRTFVDCLSKGGNLLMDIGPREDGTIVPEQVAILKEFGRWTSKHAEAIYGTRAGIPSDFFQGYTALNKAKDKLYLYIPYRPNGSVEVKGLINNIKNIRVVGSNQKLEYKIYNKLSWNDVPGNLYITIPDEALDSQITVVCIELDGPIKLYASAGQVIEFNE